MENYSIEVVDKLSEDTQQQIEREHLEYEKEHDVNTNCKTFAIIIKNKSDNIIGALSAYTFCAEAYVDDLWVSKKHRSKGLGRKLLMELKNRFKDKGFNNINLVTSEFQAPEFYKKFGFVEELLRTGHSHGTSFHYMKLDLKK